MELWRGMPLRLFFLHCAVVLGAIPQLKWGVLCSLVPGFMGRVYSEPTALVVHSFAVNDAIAAIHMSV